MSRCWFGHAYRVVATRPVRVVGDFGDEQWPRGGSPGHTETEDNAGGEEHIVQPFFVIDERYALSGAQESSVFATALKLAEQERS